MGLLTKELVPSFLNKFVSKSALTTTTQPSSNHSVAFYDRLLPAFAPKKPRSVLVKKRLYIKILGQTIYTGNRLNQAYSKNGLKRKFVEEVKSNNHNSRKKLLANPPPPPPISPPAALEAKINAMGGYDVRFVIEKMLYKTDVDKHEDRLSIPVRQIRDAWFLDEDEQKIIYKKGEELSVKVLEPSDDRCDMKLSKWNKPNSLTLRTKWKEVLGRNMDIVDKETNVVVEAKYFKKGDIIQLWSFRKQSVEGLKPEHWLALINMTRIHEEP
ncbi:putative B3 domain-containing protein At2g27410 [Mercurialis annua]|uniref:putative B3 domain-containing protein At2g27410 n=1 Tax=Mercurialis annua TaxID=3986 RepID=UPI00215EDDD5|nr:putative B3 domain-containing protein At2g27410 [Mercurialis annua]